jgi:hypothetical protein
MKSNKCIIVFIEIFIYFIYFLQKNSEKVFKILIIAFCLDEIIHS